MTISNDDTKLSLVGSRLNQPPFRLKSVVHVLGVEFPYVFGRMRMIDKYCLPEFIPFLGWFRSEYSYMFTFFQVKLSPIHTLQKYFIHQKSSSNTCIYLTLSYKILIFLIQETPYWYYRMCKGEVYYLFLRVYQCLAEEVVWVLMLALWGYCV